MATTVTEITAPQVDSAQTYLRNRIAEHAPNHAKPQDTEAVPQNEWAHFYTTCDRLIHQYAMKIGIPSEQNDDFTQEVWVKLLKKLPEFQYDSNRGRFTTWLYQLVKNTAIDQRRRVSRKPMRYTGTADDLAAATTCNDPHVHDSDLDDFAEYAIVWLEEHDSEISCKLARMRWIEERSVAEVASTLHISSQQVWTCEHRIKDKLRKKFIAFAKTEH